MKNLILIALSFFLLPFMAGCDDTPPEPVVQQPPKEAAKVIENRLDEWLGQWNGAEGTYLKIEKSGEGYAVIIKDLDKEERYLGVSKGMRIRFLRDNKEEYLALGGGHETGMKWLTKKPYCLIVKQGEAYCRDKMK